MVTPILGSRRESWRLDAITPAGMHVATLPLVPDTGRHDWELGRWNPLGLSCQIGDRLLGPALTPHRPVPSLAGLWVRLTHTVNATPHVLATCVVTDVQRVLGRGTHLAIEATDPTYVLSDLRALRRDLVLPIGTEAVSAIRDVVTTYAPELRLAIADSDATLRTDMAWPAGTDILTVVNELAEVIAFTALAPRADGTLWTAPWIPTSQRTVSLTLGPDAATQGPFVGQATITRQMHLPTEVIAISSGGQGTAAVIGRYPEAVPSNPVTAVIRGEYTSVIAANTAARRYHDEQHAAGAHTAVQGPWQPVEPGHLLGWEWPRQGISPLVGELQSLDTQWSAGSPTTFRLEGVPA